ncbi:hypothetical protein E2C01_051263 [Portunus trituberculatus]|uniref:Uncharacterized protein n=1 Tax=Portunus trituberculatus TaxID=210409 RepID=A0A5B7GIP7_PORTR|nr:hypothetical protein [Portunus trituberculatus]
MPECVPEMLDDTKLRELERLLGKLKPKKEAEESEQKESNEKQEAKQNEEEEVEAEVEEVEDGKQNAAKEDGEKEKEDGEKEKEDGEKEKEDGEKEKEDEEKVDGEKKEGDQDQDQDQDEEKKKEKKGPEIEHLPSLSEVWINVDLATPDDISNVHQAIKHKYRGMDTVYGETPDGGKYIVARKRKDALACGLSYSALEHFLPSCFLYEDLFAIMAGHQEVQEGLSSPSLSYGDGEFVCSGDCSVGGGQDSTCHATGSPLGSSSPFSSASHVVRRVCALSGCRRVLGSAHNDPHFVCIVCRDGFCDVNNRCRECAEWSPRWVLSSRQSQELFAKCSDSRGTVLSPMASGSDRDSIPGSVGPEDSISQIPGSKLSPCSRFKVRCSLLPTTPPGLTARQSVKSLLVDVLAGGNREQERPGDELGLDQAVPPHDPWGGKHSRTPKDHPWRIKQSRPEVGGDLDPSHVGSPSVQGQGRNRCVCPVQRLRPQTLG